jgi:RND family efflux transporter MFP subunit
MSRVLILLLAFAAAPVLAAPPFSVATVQYKDADQTYALEATVEAVRQSTVSAQIAGRIMEIHFDVGDTVKQGQVILRIDESEVKQQLAGSQAQVAQAQAQLANAKAHFERTRQLFEQKFVSQAALDKALSDYKAAQAQAQATLAGAGAAATTRGYATVVAPYGGVVAARHVEVGEMAQPGKPLLTGFDPGGLRVVVNVPQYKLAEARRASKALVEVPGLGKWVTAREITFLPAADARTHTTRVRLDLPADVKDVHPGMYARAHFVIGQAKKLLVPQAAILRRSEVTGVYVVDAKGLPQLRQVRLGEAAGQGEVEVLAGLAPGETIALDPIQAGIYLKNTPKGKD